MKKLPEFFLFTFFFSLILLLGAGCAPSAPITSFADCMMAGFPVTESYPRQCTANGVMYVDEIGNTIEKSGMIRVDVPTPGSSSHIASPLVISGEARGRWFFEASFPVELQDTNGNVIAQTHATAQSEWMTENFVPFIAKLVFTVPDGVTDGILYLRKDNPSGLPEHDDALWFPVQLN